MHLLVFLMRDCLREAKQENVAFQGCSHAVRGVPWYPQTRLNKEQLRRRKPTCSQPTD